MKLNWTVNPSGNGLCAYLDDQNIMATVYRCIVEQTYIQMVWIAGQTTTYSKSSHACCISAMVHAEAAVTELADELTAKSAIWQEV